MVVPIRDFGNKFFLSSTNIHFQQTFNLPTVFSSTNTGMDILPRNIPDNYDEVRSRIFSPSLQSSRISSIFSTKSSVAYHKKIEYNNSLKKDVDIDNDSPWLSYETLQEQAIHASMVAGPNNNIRKKCVMIKHPTSSSSHVPIKYPISGSPCINDLVINIQLLYDLNAPIEPELWNGNFHPISLYESIKYLASDSKNIKNFLNFIAKYITNKQVDHTKSNDLKDLNGIGEAI